MRNHLPTLGAFALIFIGLIVVRQYVDYLLVHALAETFSIVTAFTIFVLSWNSRRYLNNGYLLFLGISLFFVAGVDLLHMLGFKGMLIFPGTGSASANLGTQLWLAGRYLQAIALVIAPFFLRRKFNPTATLAIFALVTGLLVASIFAGIFPVSYVDGAAEPLTPFKIYSEYVIMLLYGVGLLELLRIRDAFSPDVLRLLAFSIIADIATEIAFTEYLSVNDFINLLGHFLKIIAFYLIYKAIIEMGFLKPQEILFHELDQREKALQASEERERARAAQLEAIMDAAPAVIWIAHDAQARRVTGNRASAALLGLPPNVNHSHYEPAVSERYKFLDHTGREMSMDDLALHIAAATGQPVRDIQETVVSQDGQARHLFGSVTPLLDETGQPAGAVAAFVDFTERVLAERALRDSEQRYRGLFETMAEGLSIQEVIFDDQGEAIDYRILEVNPAFERMMHRTRDQLVGFTVRQLLPNLISGWIAKYAQVVRSGEAARFEDYSYLAGRYFEALVSPMGGNTCAALAIDVTERRQSRDALRLSEARLRRLVESNIIGIIYYTLEGRITQANDAFLDIVGYTREDFDAGKMVWTQLTPPEYLPLDEKGIAEAKERGACTPYEKEYIRKDGQRVPVLIGYAYLGDDDPLFSCFILDLTEQKQAEAEVRIYAARLESSNLDLQRANRELQDFAFVASHDMQEPLRKIQAFSERLKVHMQDNLDEESRDYLTRMLNATGRMRAMIDDLLALSRVTTRGKSFARVNLNEVAREVISDLEVRIERTHGTVELGELPSLEGDPIQMQQLLQNLIGNALKFHRENIDPVVYIDGECTGDGQNVIIRVKDNGIGFDLQYLDRIFQPFQRLHGMGQYEGSGIGLAVCRKIVERHGGTITAESIPGQGSTFTVTMPARQPRNLRD